MSRLNSSLEARDVRGEDMREDNRGEKGRRETEGERVGKRGIN